MKVIKQIATICFTLSLVACTASPVQETQQSKAQGAPVVGEEQGEFETARQEAAKALKRANEAGHEWKNSGKFLKKADQAAKKGNYEKAMKLVEVARQEGELALHQSKQQAGAGPRLSQISAKIKLAENEIALAKAARKAANKVGHEWKNTGKFLKKAEQAADAMNYGKAAKLAKTARLEGELAQIQAVDQRNAGPRF